MLSGLFEGKRERKHDPADAGAGAARNALRTLPEVCCLRVEVIEL
jgi:hypothetical protein